MEVFNLKKEKDILIFAKSCEFEWAYRRRTRMVGEEKGKLFLLLLFVCSFIMLL